MPAGEGSARRLSRKQMRQRDRDLLDPPPCVNCGKHSKWLTNIGRLCQACLEEATR
jgi:hypothetical protein